MIKHSSKTNNKAYRFSIAPMLDCTDRHYRVMMRHISKRALLYSEMIVAKALHYSDNRNLLLDFDEIEHPLSLQVGGDEPNLLAEASRMAESWGYDEINLNIGCPSAKVKAGNFGACLMEEPHQVAKCIESMVNASKLPVTVKHRIGINKKDDFSFLQSFVDIVSKAGAERFSIHARIAWLEGLNPKENRTVPPLQYKKVEKLKKERPFLKIELNGGIKTPNDCLKALEIFDGVMVGRAAYENPFLWNTIDEIIFNEKNKKLKRSEIIKSLIPYAENHLKRNGKIWNISRHILNLMKGIPNAKEMRNEIAIYSQKNKNNLKVIEKTAQQLELAGL